MQEIEEEDLDWGRDGDQDDKRSCYHMTLT